jgi:hypothetical protein
MGLISPNWGGGWFNHRTTVQVVKVETIKPDINTGGQPIFGDDPVFMSRKKRDGNGPPVGLEAPVAAVRAS